MTDEIPYPGATLDEARELMRGPLGREMVKLAPMHMTWLTFGRFGEEGEIEELHNGTCFFLKTSKKTFGVTARHVLDGWRKFRDLHTRVRCQMGNILIDLSERVIGEGNKADIATFEITANELLNLGKIPIGLWPPDPPDGDDKGVLVAGYPSESIDSVDPFSRCFGIYSACGIAQRVTDRQLVCRVEWDEVQPTDLAPLPPYGFNTGGMSGGPVMSVRERNGIITFPIAGIISEGDPSRDTIYAERADEIRADGSIRS